MTGSSEWPPNCLDVQNALGLPTSALERWFQFQLDRSGRTVSQPISLTELANKYGSDKGNAVRFRHDYTALYEPIFAPLRLHPIPLLEIGLAVSGPEGGSPIERVANAPSIAMWLQYFPHARSMAST